MSETVHLFIIATLATAIIGAYGWGWRLHNAITERYEDDAAKARGVADAALQSCHGRITTEIQRLHQDFYEYKLHVANDFATLRHLRESEDRTHRSLSDISGKLDRLIEGRMQK
jgi:hypothetical protein